MPPSIRTAIRSLLLLLAIALSSSARAEEKPKVIRISFPGVGVGGRPFSGGTALATAHLRGVFEEEFKKDGIRIEWLFLRGAGPAVNELFANDLVDFSSLGDLPSVIGRASGLKVRVLAGQSTRSNIYVSVPSDSSVESVANLKGKRVAVTKGTATHLAGLKILAKFGLTEKDVKVINMDTPTAQAALATKDVDAVLGGTDYLRLRDQGISRIVYDTRKSDPDLTSNSSFVAAEKFINQYPETTVRVLKVLLQTGKYVAEESPVKLFQLWTKTGTTFSSYKEDLQGIELKWRYNPLLDPYHEARYKLQISDAKRLGLIRQPFAYEQWIEPKFLKQALKELGLENYWQPRRANGQVALQGPSTPAPVAPAAAQASRPSAGI